MCLRGLNRGRLAGTELLVYLQQSFLAVSGLILLHDSLGQSLVNTESSLDLLISAKAESTDECGYRDLSVLIYTDINDIVRVHFILEPCTSVRYNGGLEQILTCLVLIKGIVNTGRTYQLRYDNTLCTVDNECTAVGHLREFAHEDLRLLDLSCFEIVQSCGNSQGNSVRCISRLALCDRVL